MSAQQEEADPLGSLASQVPKAAPSSDAQKTLSLSMSHQGPLPLPAMLRAYDEIVQDGAERIFRMAESEQTHRCTQDRRRLDGNLSLARTGQYLAALIIMAVLGTATVLIINGHSLAGLTALVVALGALARSLMGAKQTEGSNSSEPPPTP